MEQLNDVVILGLKQGTSTLVVGGTRYPNHEPNVLTANPERFRLTSWPGELAQTGQLREFKSLTDFQE
jgi:hypothetical protein